MDLICPPNDGRIIGQEYLNPPTHTAQKSMIIDERLEIGKRIVEEEEQKEEIRDEYMESLLKELSIPIRYPKNEINDLQKLLSQTKYCF